jgi:hypothetical protein
VKAARMRTRRERFARIIVTASWIGGIGLALRLGIASSEPMEVFGLLVVVYLSVWGLAFFLCPNATTTNAARFLLTLRGSGSDWSC